MRWMQQRSMEPAFSMEASLALTIHRAEGRTTRRVIVVPPHHEGSRLSKREEFGIPLVFVTVSPGARTRWDDKLISPRQTGRRMQMDAGRRHGHVLKPFIPVPATDRRLLGSLFDIMQRRKIIEGVKASVKGHNWALQVVEQISEEDPMEGQLLQEAVQRRESQAL